MEGSEKEMVDLVETSRIEAKVTIVHSKGSVFDLIAEELTHGHVHGPGGHHH
jgi:hypothetical protein